MNGNVTEEQFKALSPDHQSWLVFNTLQSRDEECKRRCKDCSLRFQALENRKRKDSLISVVTGIVSGLSAFGMFILGVLKGWFSVGNG